MTTIEAIYENGVFRPLGEVKLPENQRVKLEVEPVTSDAIAWFEEMRQAREQLAAKYGLFPDSTARSRRTVGAMSDVAIDSSVAVKWVLPESDSPRAEQCGLDVIQTGGQCLVERVSSRAPHGRRSGSAIPSVH